MRTSRQVETRHAVEMRMFEIARTLGDSVAIVGGLREGRTIRSSSALRRI